MALHLLSALLSTAVPSAYYFPAVGVLLLLVIVRGYTQGRRTNRDRDLHARTVILTGAFTPIGITLLEFLAKKGAHIVALVPTASLTSHHDEILTLLRSTTLNESIYAEPCPLDSPSGIKKFCERFVNTENEKDRRVDALIMAHEYAHIGAWNTGIERVTSLIHEESMKRDEGAMATFLLTTLLLPALLVAPLERDIRIINFVNPFYAAAAPEFNPRLSSAVYNPVSERKPNTNKSNPAPSSIEHFSSWSLEGRRGLRTAVFTRHLQRILDALPEPESSSASTPALATGDSSTQNVKPRKSNILAVTVSPGISRTDTISPYLLPSASLHKPSVTRQWVGATLYTVFLPLLHLLTKTPTSALQSVIHVLCLPKPHARRRIPVAEDVAQPPPETPPQTSGQTRDVAKATEEEEVLVPGALYADCSVVRLDLHVSKSVGIEDQGQHNDPEQFELGLGNEPLGRAVWEALEGGVKIWEQRERAI